jgi:hypothetical protein
MIHFASFIDCSIVFVSNIGINNYDSVKIKADYRILHRNVTARRKR